MLSQFHNKKTSSGFTLVELVISIAVLSLIGVMLSYWITTQNKYSAKITSAANGQQVLAIANWKMANELKLSRTILYPRMNKDGSIHSDSKVVFKNITGEIICYYLDQNTKDLRRVFIGNQHSTPKIDSKPLAQGIDELIFTCSSLDNKLLDIYIKSGDAFGIESIYLLNE